MSARLSSVLVQEGLLAVKGLQDALTSQAIKGGGLDTILLEMGAVDESALLAVLSRTTGYPPLTATLLAAATPDVASAIDRGATEQLGICPVRQYEDDLLVLASPTADHVRIEELAFDLGCRIVPFAATELRVQQARATVYGDDLTARFETLLSTCGPQPPLAAPEERALGDDEGFNVLPPLPTGSQSTTGADTILDLEADSETDEHPTLIPDPAPSPQMDAAVREGDRPDDPGEGEDEEEGEEEGEGEEEEEEEDDDYDDDVDDDVSVNVDEDEAETDAAQLNDVGVDADADADADQDEDIDDGDADPSDTAPGLGSLGSERTAIARVDLVPVAVAVPAPTSAGRPEAERPRAAAAPAIAPTIAAETTPSAALNIVEAIASMVRAKDRAGLLQALLRGAHSQLSVVHAYAVQRTEAHGRFALADGQLDAVAVRERRFSLDEDSVLAVAAETGEVFIGPVPADDRTAALLDAIGLAAPHVVVVPLHLRKRPVLLLIGHCGASAPAHEARALLGELGRQGSAALVELIIRRKREDAASRAGERKKNRRPRAARPGPASSSPATVVAATAPKSASRSNPDARPPLGDELEGLLATLEGGGQSAEDAVQRLADGGKRVVDTLTARFPGDTRSSFPDTKAGLVAVSSLGPELHALVRLGRPVVPAIAPLLRDSDVRRRFYATYLLTELVYPEAVSLLAARLRDDDERVRKVATAGLRRYPAFPAFADVLGALKTDLHNRDPRPRQAAVEAMGALREIGMIPTLIELLVDPVPGVRTSARGALVRLARQDFHRRQPEWREWWATNRPRHRIEWLVDGLVHDSADIRRSAGEELADITGVWFGDTVEAPWDHRDEVRSRYRQWWDTEGKAKFDGDQREAG